MIEVTVKTLDGKNRAFSVPDEITVKQFKKTIAASIEIKADIQRLIFKGRILSDEMKINDYDVNGKTIHVVQKLPPVTTSSTSTTSSSTDPIPSRTRDSEESGRSGRRIFLGSYALAPDGTNVMQQILDDLGETMGQGQRTQTQNQDDGLSSSSLNSPAASQSRGGSGESLNRINHIKKLIASAKRSLELLESPGAENDANLEDSEQNEPTGDQMSSAEQGTSSQGAAEQDQDSLSPPASVLADLLDEVMLINERLQPHLVLYQQHMRDQCAYRKKSRKLDNAQRLCNLVPRTMHFVSHVYHSLSDLSVDVSSAPPRRIQAPSRRSATIIQQTIPVLQAEISLSGGPLANVSDALLNSTATTGSTTEPQSSVSAELTEPESGSARSRSMTLPPRPPRFSSNLGSMSWTSAPGTSSLSSVFPLFFSSSLGSSLMPTNISRAAASSVATTSTSMSASAASTSSTSSATVAPSTTSTSTTTGASNRSGGRRGYRRFTESARTRPSVNVSTQDFGDLGVRHLDPYLACHSRHFRTRHPAQTSTSSSTGRNSNSSLADMISNIVSSIMTTTGELPADASATGRHGNEEDGPAATSFTTHFDSPAQALRMLDDPEMEEEVISSWHPLDDDVSPFVRNIFSATERSAESARLDHQILNMMINRDNWLEGLLCCVLDCLSFTEMVTVLSGVLTPLTRLREPLQEFVTSTVLNGEEPTDDNLSRAVDHMMDDLVFCLEEIACDLEPLMDVDFASSLSSFLRYHLKKILGMIMKSTEETDFSETLCSLLRRLSTELVCLCEGCLSRDGFVTLIQQRLWHFLPFGVHSAIRNWTQVQLRHFQRSVLPSALQSVVYERHVVFTPQSNSANGREAPATVEPLTGKETTKKPGKESNGVNDGSEIKEENASTSQGPSSSSALNLVVDENTKDRCRRGRKSLPNHDDNLVEEVSIKRRRISNCEGQNGSVEWTSVSVTDAQNDSDEPRPSVAVTFSRDTPFEDGSASSNERLQNGLEPTAPTLFPDAEDLSSTKN